MVVHWCNICRVLSTEDSTEGRCGGLIGAICRLLSTEYSTVDVVGLLVEYVGCYLLKITQKCGRLIGAICRLLSTEDSPEVWCFHWCNMQAAIY